MPGPWFNVKLNAASQWTYYDHTTSTWKIIGANTSTPTIVNSATYTVLPGDTHLLVKRTATGACAINIPSAGFVEGRRLIITDAGLNAAANNITVTSDGAETFEGAANYKHTVDGESYSWIVFEGNMVAY